MSVTDCNSIGNKIYGTWEETAAKVGNFTNSAQDNVLTAFSLKEGDTTGLTDLKSAMNIEENINVEGIRLIAQQRYEQAMRAIATFSRLLSNMHQMLMSIISNIRFR